MIAWRYLRARRSEGGVSVMTWISLIGITLAVAALIITMAVRSGFRAEFVDTILGANAHVTVYSAGRVAANGQFDRAVPDYDEIAKRLSAVDGVIRAAPLVRGQVMANAGQQNAFADVRGIRAADLAAIPRIADPATSQGSLDGFERGIALGSELARDLGVSLGDRVKLISPNGAKTPFGTSPRVNGYEVVYIFSAGRYDIDKVRLYMPFAEAQSFFNSEGVADEIEVMVDNPDQIDSFRAPLMKAAGAGALLWTWRDSSGAFLEALAIEDTVMFVLMAVLVLIASLNITSGLVMLVKNKGRDIGILRTMGLSQGSILRVFFLCGAMVGLIGTALGVVLGCLFALYFDPILAFVNGASGGDVWDASIRGIYRLPAVLRWQDVLGAVGLSLILSFGITIFPARRAARMNPVEALRYE
ncbi:lipoprotein-releasing ABC transporter permease subunit [Aliiroseovarius sp. PTFE2010]|uniref:lipoprotein-releasing ABC transporter permease subunit n=1 Tax=Aliiroseovarius sp. PTFE2010 TaxID=3417190 RepID=UPI003CF0C9E4